jgi:hypothetical protein
MRKINWPVALPALRMPSTRPRRAVNQRVEIVVAMTSAVIPGATPSATPRPIQSCHLEVIVIASMSPAMSKTTDHVSTLRGPLRRINPPANGATRPNSIMRKPSGPESSPIDQPRSWEIGVSRTPGMDIAPAAHTLKKNVSATMSQP